MMKVKVGEKGDGIDVEDRKGTTSNVLSVSG